MGASLLTKRSCREFKNRLTTYEIRVQGHLSPQRFRRFEGLTVSHQPGGETVLTGSFSDQAALYGLLNWLRDLGASLVSVKRLESGAGTHN